MLGVPVGMSRVLLAVAAWLPHPPGAPSPVPLHHLAASLPQLGRSSENVFCLWPSPHPGINGTWAGAAGMNAESRVLLLCGHRLYCMKRFLSERPAPLPARGTAKENTHG